MSLVCFQEQVCPGRWRLFEEAEKLKCMEMLDWLYQVWNFDCRLGMARGSFLSHLVEDTGMID